MSKCQYLVYSSSSNPVSIKPLMIIKASSKTEAKTAASKKIDLADAVRLIAIHKRDAFDEDVDQAIVV